MQKQIREVAVSDLLLYFALPLVLLAVLIFGVVLGFVYLLGAWKLLLLIALIPLYYVLKYLAIGTVLLYKATAPLSMRDACRFEPTCSPYMIISIRKYGLFRGVYRGIRRIMRCKPPHGGIDLP